MADKTEIQWTDATWNPTTGCTKVSPGCANCYIERTPPFRIAGRKFDGKGHIPLVLNESRLDAPLRRRKPTKYFVNSLSDLFHEDVPDAFIDKVFAVMALAKQHTFQVLTKRADRMRDYCSKRPPGVLFSGQKWHWIAGVHFDRPDLQPWPLPNVWLGVSVENQRFSDERIPLLLQTPAAVRFISAEPLLGPVELDEAWLPRFDFRPTYGYYRTFLKAQGIESDGKPVRMRDGLDWVIVGGESGKGARPFDVDWARSIVQQCQAAGVPVFVKQLGAVPIVPAGRLRHWEWGGEIGRGEARFEATDPANPSSMPWRVVLDDKKGGDITEWPEDLRVRQFPVEASR